MKILSINCNKFGGSEQNGKGEIYSEQIMSNLVLLAKFHLDLDENNLVIFHEVNYRKEYYRKFKNKFCENAYKIHEPTNLDKIVAYGCTLAITKNNTYWNKIDSLGSNSKDYANKSVILTHSDFIVVGVHVPYNMKYWDLILQYFKNKKDEKIIIIGDMNTYDEGTDRKEKFNKLVSYGAIDAWVEKGGKKDKETYSKSRLDYALMSKSAYSELKSIKIIDSIRNDNISDHSGIYIDMNEKD
jgi:exonuclease III